MSPTAQPSARPQERSRHVPQRTCVGCGAERPKRELVRLVLPAEGRVVVDPTGKRSGRGAYICRDRGTTCLAQARRRRAIPRALRTSAERVDIEALAADIAAVLQEERSSPH